jgi:excisionase family DNA binding protein
VDRLFSITECAELTSTTPAFWRKLLYRRAIPYVKVGRLTRIREADLEAWLRLGLPGRPNDQALQGVRSTAATNAVFGREGRG